MADYAPGRLVLLDRIVDRTKGVRPVTFFGDGPVAHVPMADSFCPRLRSDLPAAAKAGTASACEPTR